MKHQYHPDALAELFAAAEWYESELPGLDAALGIGSIACLVTEGFLRIL